MKAEIKKAITGNAIGCGQYLVRDYTKATFTEKTKAALSKTKSRLVLSPFSAAAESVTEGNMEFFMALLRNVAADFVLELRTMEVQSLRRNSVYKIT